MRQVLKLQAEIEDTMAQAEAKGEEGEVDEAEELMKKVEVSHDQPWKRERPSKALNASVYLYFHPPQELKQQKAEVQSKLVAEAVAKGQMDVSAGMSVRPMSV